MSETDPLTAGLLFRVPSRPRANATPSSYSRPKSELRPIHLSASPTPSRSSLPHSTLKQLCDSNPVPLAVRAAAAAFRAAQRDHTPSQIPPAVADDMLRAAEDVYQTPVQPQGFLPLTPVSRDRDELRGREREDSPEESLHFKGAQERIELFGEDDAYRRRLSSASFVQFRGASSAVHEANSAKRGFQDATLDQVDDVQFEDRVAERDDVNAEGPAREGMRYRNRDLSGRLHLGEALSAHKDYPSARRRVLVKREDIDLRGIGLDAHEAHGVEANEVHTPVANGNRADMEDIITPVREHKETTIQNGGERAESDETEHADEENRHKAGDASVADENDEEIMPSASVETKPQEADVEHRERALTKKDDEVSKVQSRSVARSGEQKGAKKVKVKRRSSMSEVLRLQKSLETARWTNARAVREQKEVIFIPDDESPTAVSDMGHNRRTPRRLSSGSRNIKQEPEAANARTPSKTASRRKKVRVEAGAGDGLHAASANANALSEEHGTVEETRVISGSRRTSKLRSTPRKARAASPIAGAENKGSRTRKRARATRQVDERELAEEEDSRMKLRKTRGQTSGALQVSVSRKRSRSMNTSKGVRVSEVVSRLSKKNIRDVRTRDQDERHQGLRRDEEKDAYEVTGSEHSKRKRKGRPTKHKESSSDVLAESKAEWEDRDKGQIMNWTKCSGGEMSEKGQNVKEGSADGNGQLDEGAKERTKTGRSSSRRGTDVRVVEGRKLGGRKGRGESGKVGGSAKVYEEEEVSSGDEMEWELRDDDWVGLVKAWVVERKVERGGWDGVKADEMGIFVRGGFGLGEKAERLIPELGGGGGRRRLRDGAARSGREGSCETERTESEGLSSEDIVKRRRGQWRR